MGNLICKLSHSKGFLPCLGSFFPYQIFLLLCFVYMKLTMWDMAESISKE